MNNPAEKASLRAGARRSHGRFGAPLRAMTLGAAALLSSAAWAQTPIRMLVGFPPGGGVDPLARIISDAMSPRLSASIVIDNRTGAGGAIAAQALKQAAPDGNTFMFTMDHQIVVAPYTMKDVGYDVDKDFIPVAQVVSYDLCFGVNSTVKAATLKDFIEESKKSSNGINVAIPAPGSVPQFITFVMNKQSGANFTPVPYRGGGAAMTDLLGNQVPAAISPCVDFMDRVGRDKGNLRVLAVAGPNRLQWAPEAPTLSESGFQVDTNFWIGIYAPAKVAEKRLAEVQAALAQAMADPDLLQRVRTMGFEPKLRTAKDFGATVKSGGEYWKSTIRESGFTPQ